MADVKKQVLVEFNAETRDMKRAMQEFKAYQQEMRQNTDKLVTDRTKSSKGLLKISQQTEKAEKLTRGKAAVQAEKALFREVKKTTDNLVGRQKAYKGIVQNTDALKMSMRAVTQETNKAGQAMKRAMSFFGGGRGGARGGGPGAPGAGGGGGGGGGGAFLSGLIKGISGAVAVGVMGLVGGAFGILTGQLSGGYQERIQYGRQYGALAGTGGKLGALERQKGFGAKMGFGAIEMAQQALPFARATGVVGGDALRQGMALQRATTLQAGEASEFMGTLTQAGTGFGGRGGGGGKQELIKTLALGMYSGLDRARMPEFFAATSTLVQRQMAATSGRVGGSDAAELLAMLGASGKSGLMGARGGAVASALDQAIRQPGGGEAGQAFMLQAMGFGKPGGGSSYYEAIRKQEQGVFGEGNLESIFSESSAQYGGGQAQILALRNLTGLTIDQLEAVRDVVESNMSNAQKQEALKKIQDESKSIEAQALDEMKEFGDTTTHIAALQNRSIEIGDSIKNSVEEIQRVVNEAIARAMPYVVKALEKIAEIVENIWNYIKTWLDPQFTDKQHEQLKEQFKAAVAAGKSETEKAIAASQARVTKLSETADPDLMDYVVLGGNIMARVGEELTGGRGADIDDIVAQSPMATAQRQIVAERQEQQQAQLAMDLSAADMERMQSALVTRRVGLEQGGVTSPEREHVSALNQAIIALSESFESESASRHQEVMEQSRALLSAVDEFRRSGVGRPPNESRGTNRPTRSGRGD